MPSPQLPAPLLREMPPDPPFPQSSLRLAQLSDLARISVVPAAGIFYSRVFHYERPRHNRYPPDTLSEFKKLFRSAILRPKKVVFGR